MSELNSLPTNIREAIEEARNERKEAREQAIDVMSEYHELFQFMKWGELYA
jgi:hypothetical protein